MKLCSACLLGVPCRYDGTSKPHNKVLELAKMEVLIPVCPEQLGGLTTPREASEKSGERVVTQSGKDITEAFQKGAESVLLIAKLTGASEAILKQRSPSCGCGKIYDGTFSGNVIDGNGVTAALLKKEGIKVITEEEIP
jgi:uncharacterized protein YbbK (DUF523 family)